MCVCFLVILRSNCGTHSNHPAQPFYRHCCKMTRGGGLGRGNEGNDLGNLALALKRAGKLEESLKVYDDALAVLRSEGPKETAGLPRLQPGRMFVGGTLSGGPGGKKLTKNINQEKQKTLNII